MIFLVLLVAACAGPAPLTGFRKGGPIYSNAVLGPTDLVGDWQQVAAFAQNTARRCRAGQVELQSAANGLLASGRLCLNGQSMALSGVLTASGPGRFMPTGRVPPTLAREWWVLWADTNLRTLVIGTPDGAFGFILNRGGPLPADRMTAAADILDWNGYDTRALRAMP